MKTAEERRAYMREYMRMRRASDPVFLAKTREHGRNSRVRHAVKRREQSKDWRANNKERMKEYAIQYNKENADRIRIARKKRSQWARGADNERHQKWVARNRQWFREYTRNYSKRRSATDPTFHMKTIGRGRVYTALKGKSKASATNDLLGCSYEQFRQYIEGKFLPGMNWANRKEWHVDHIRPLAAFDLSKEDEQRAAFHYTNTQPLWKLDNLRKGAKLDWSAHA